MKAARRALAEAVCMVPQHGKAARLALMDNLGTTKLMAMGDEGMGRSAWELIPREDYLERLWYQDLIYLDKTALET